MSYIVGQYNHNKDSGDDSSFIDLITAGTADRRQNQSDSGIIGSSLDPFKDECVRVGTLSASKYYYFRGQIKRLKSEQIIYIKLVNYETSVGEAIEQYIKTITIQGGNPDEWVSVEFIFHPVVQFDCILFQLQRTIDDYRIMARYPKIAYQELGVVKNIVSAKIGTDINLLKIGVQSHPSLMMCINGEEIRTPRSGIYEIKNGILPINFFSVVNAAIENTTSLETWMTSIGSQSLAIEKALEAGTMTVDTAIQKYEAMQSKCFFDTSKTISLDPFTLDYMYEG